MTIVEIADQIRQNAPPHKPVLIGVEGYGGSGKSTFAALLGKLLKRSYVINFDDFLIKESICNADKSGFDKSRLKEEVLAPAKNSKPIAYRRLVWAKNELSKPIIVPTVDYIIIEGVSCYHPSVIDYYDFKIWVEAPMLVAKSRGVERDKNLGINNERQWDVWVKTDIDYQNKYHPDEVADFVFDNSKQS